MAHRLLSMLLLFLVGPLLPACKPPSDDEGDGGTHDGFGESHQGTKPDLLEPPCVRTFSCDARTAEHGCGVTTATGQRHPDRGSPYCSDKLDPRRCSCELIRCPGPALLCPGTYRVTFRERLLAGCDGVPMEYGGTCQTLWNTVQIHEGGQALSEQALYNIQMDFGTKDYEQIFTLTAEARVRLSVRHYCWFPDVQGIGNTGRAEVESARLVPLE